MIILRICMPCLFSGPFPAHDLIWAPGESERYLSLVPWRFLGFQRPVQTKYPQEGKAPCTFIGSHLGGSWQLADDQALRSRKQDWEGLGNGQEEKEAWERRWGCSTHLPATHLSFAKRGSRQGIPCFPHPLDTNSTPTKPKVEKTRRKREVTGKKRKME